MEPHIDLPAEPEPRARVLAFYALLMCVGGFTHDRAAIDAAEAILRVIPQTSHPVEAHARAEALSFLSIQAEAIQKPRSVKVRNALLPRIQAAELVLVHTRPVDRLADVMRRTA